MSLVTFLICLICCLMLFLYCYTMIKTVRHVSRAPELNFGNSSSEHDEIFSNITLGIPTGNLYQPGFFNEPPDICPNKNDPPLKLLVGVITKSGRKTQRTSIRKTWGHYGLRYDVAVVFIYGNDAREITYEIDTYRDVLITQNSDLFVYKALKTVSLMEFIMSRCPNVEYVLKTNDYNYVNVPTVLKIIRDIPKGSRNVYGLLRSGETTIRNQKLFRYVSESQYNEAVLPDYLQGDAYLFPGFLAKELYKETLSRVFVHVEDVFISGIVAKNLGISRVNCPEFNDDNSMGSTKFSNISSIAYVKTHSASKQFKLWAKINQLCDLCDVFI